MKWNKMIIFALCKKFGLEKNEQFRFTNQKGKCVYFFTDDGLMKAGRRYLIPSNVKLNWLLDDACQIEKCGQIWNMLDENFEG
jgi:hypothetical protein